MKLLNLEWRNIQSYGNKTSQIDFSGPGELWQLSGRSGAGKSTILNLPQLLFYGKVKGVKVPDIANRVNKNGYIKGTCQVGSDNYIIERTFSPSGVTVYKNGENIDKAGIKDMQQFIENEIVRLPYNIFTNIITLSLNNFKSFVTMSPDDKRQIIDKLFALDIINKVYELIRKDEKELANAINISNGQIYTITENIKKANEELDKLVESNKNQDAERLAKLKDALVKINEMLGTNTDNYNKYAASKNGYVNLYNTTNSQYQKANAELNVIKNKINLFNNDKCPTCGADFTSSEFESIKQTLISEKTDKEKEMTDIYNILKSYKDYIAKLDEGIKTLNNNIFTIKSKKTTIESEIKKIESSDNSDTTISIQNIINANHSDKNALEKEVEGSLKRLELIKVLENMYGSDGVKKDLMRNYIPSLNEEIHDTLIDLSFPYTLEFDEQFNPTLTYLGEEIAVETLSEGEHKRVDIAVLCSMIKLIKKKFPQFNLICLDETLSSLDYDSSVDVIKHLLEISQDLDLHIIIVSHTVLPEEYFNKRLIVNKNAGFSEFKYLEN